MLLVKGLVASEIAQTLIAVMFHVDPPKKKNEKNFVSIPVRNCVHNRVENLRVVMLLQVRPTYQLLCPHLHSHVFYLFFHDVMCDIRKSTGDHYYY